MLLQIDGDLNKYYIQTLCMLFYPGAKFAEDDDDKTQSAHFIRVDRDDGVEVSCTFRAEDKSGQATHFEPVGGASMHLGCGSNSDPTTKASKLAAGIAAALTHFDRIMPGFIRNGKLVGVETCVSSPFRFRRDLETLESSLSGLYLSGEGAGCAGGIMSAAADGLRIALAMLRRG